MTIARHLTALTRHKLSRPISLAIADRIIDENISVFDYGCGRGDDIRNLNDKGIACSGWDPVYHSEGKAIPSDVVNLGYVINVIEDVTERASVLQKAWALAQSVLIVSARLLIEVKDTNLKAYEDGCLTRLSTFQKFYEQYELRNWIDEVLHVSCVPAAPGVFYVFRDDEKRLSFAASRYSRVAATPRQRRSDFLFEQYKAVLEPLMRFIAHRGRLPEDSELEETENICREIGSLKRAFTIIRRATGAEHWDKIREERAQDLLMYIALSKLSYRPRYSQLPSDLRLDIRAFFSTYRRACEMADELLFSAGNASTIDAACRASTVGKLTPNALYIHTSALAYLPTVLRIYEGCARSFIGAVDDANVIKLHRGVPQVSYLAYPDFDRNPHPALAASLIVPLQTFRVQFRDYTESKNPFILHRKEEFLHVGYPLRQRFVTLTRQEEKHHLYDKPEIIGTRDGWQKVLEAGGVRLNGHRLVRRQV
jgi:DNA phosphorothioation-associated putative methyltransferase